jgi:LysM repeat protein
MKSRLFASLLVCALLLAGCYRQTEEPFQQVDSAEAVEAATSVPAAGSELSGDGAADEGSTVEGDGAAADRQYITPEALPGQIEQPTVGLLTSEAAESAALPRQTLTPFVFSSPTLSFEEQLDPEAECVYQVQAGNVLFRLALAWGTTYQAIMEVNQLDSENLSIGQLLLIPDCESSEPEESPTQESAIVGPVIGEDGGEGETELAEEAATAEATVEVAPTATPGPKIHVVSAGETIESISLRYRVDVNELIALNELSNPNRLNVGQELRLPE